jgi:hypothetical protein
LEDDDEDEGTIAGKMNGDGTDGTERRRLDDVIPYP